ncbi:MAG: hypothetical protein IK128_01585 [Clostridiales bacterium]|nr:hypothetical protein [Clostridiales bacterium]MBR5357886.1 hypothetical protein [Clostridiales bacterium]
MSDLKKTFTSLWTGELVAVLVFWFDYFVFKWIIPGIGPIVSVTYALIILSFILVQGSAFWLIMLKRLSDPKYMAGIAGKIFKILKYIDVILMCLGVAVIFIFPDTVFAMVFAFLVLLFALIEWINYYLWRLSYSMDPSVLLGRIKNRRLKKSKIAKEIENS